MNREEIKTDIETEKLYLEDCETTVKVVREHLAALEAQLAEAEKPGLKHLDWGPDKTGHMHVALLTNENDDSRIIQASMHPAGAMQVFDYASDCPIVSVKGNFAADLKALAEPLKEFKVTDKQNERTIRFHGSLGNLYIEITGKDGERVRNINIPLRESALNLRRLIQHAQLLEAH